MSNTAKIVNINRSRRHMPSKNGYVSLWRDIKKQPFYKDLIARSMFMDMLLEAQHKSTKIEVNGVSVFLNSGQLFTKRRHFVDQGINDSKAKRVLEKFEKLGIITRSAVKQGNRCVGQRITFLNWSKWQKIDQSTDQSTDQPQPTEIKALRGGSDQSSDQSTDHINNNVINNNKDHVGSETLQGGLSLLRKKAFQHFWCCWLDCKKIAKWKNTAPKSKTFTNVFCKLFTLDRIEKMGVDEFKEEINKICDFAHLAHADIAEHGEQSAYLNHQRMFPQKFLNNRQWGDQ